MHLFQQGTKNTVNPKANYLIVISAPSGAGKTTLCQKLLEDFPSIVLSISSTTRSPRGAEKDGIEYFFLSHADFEKRIKEDRFAEWALVHGNYYGTSKEVIDAAFQNGNSVLLDIDVQGADKLYQSYPKECYRIFIAPPSMQELEFRLRARRTESEENIQKRLANAQIEIAESKKFDSIIVNDSLERAYQELKDLIQKKLRLQPLR
jgi:guanylate kinase